MEPVKWFDRKFDFSFKENIFPMILERLQGTPVRLENKTGRLSPDILEVKIENGWSIKENIGHLTDLEPLWQQRFDDIVSGHVYMRPTDLANNKTELANHNSKSVAELINDFKEIRNQTMKMLENIDEALIFKSSLHPRLKSPMRTQDLFLFVAEHDDHHLARMTAIANHLQNYPKTAPTSKLTNPIKSAI